MSFQSRELARVPSVEQYKKQAKDLVRFRREAGDSRQEQLQLERLFKLIQQYHPQFRKKPEAEIRAAAFALSDAQLVIAREHGFATWPKFVQAVEAKRAGADTGAGAGEDPAAAFLRAASVPRGEDHDGSGATIDAAEAIRKAHRGVETSSIWAAAVFGDAAAVRGFLAKDAGLAAERGGVYAWDALTYLCFSRYLRAWRGDAGRMRGFVEAARALLDAGADVDTGWFDGIGEITPAWESAMYGAAALADNAELTQLLLDHGADPNDEETAYHAAESYDPAVLKVLLASGKLNEWAMTTLLLRKGDVHDAVGMKLVLEAGANPNQATQWGRTPAQHTLLRDNWLQNTAMQLDHWPMVEVDGVLKPAPEVVNHDESMAWIAARRGRGDVLRLLRERGFPVVLDGVRGLVAACALGDEAEARRIAAERPELLDQLREKGGNLLSDFAGNGNVEGLRLLLNLGLDVGMTTRRGDPYFDVARGGTALHSAAWRGRHEAVRFLLERGAAVNAVDGRWRTPLMRAVSACVESYWMDRRSPESVEMLLRAGASVKGVRYPCGYDAVDRLLREHGAS